MDQLPRVFLRRLCLFLSPQDYHSFYYVCRTFNELTKSLAGEYIRIRYPSVSSAVMDSLRSRINRATLFERGLAIIASDPDFDRVHMCVIVKEIFNQADSYLEQALEIMNASRHADFYRQYLTQLTSSESFISLGSLRRLIEVISFGTVEEMQVSIAETADHKLGLAVLEAITAVSIRNEIEQKTNYIINLGASFENMFASILSNDTETQFISSLLSAAQFYNVQDILNERFDVDRYNQNSLDEVINVFQLDVLKLPFFQKFWFKTLRESDRKYWSKMDHVNLLVQRNLPIEPKDPFVKKVVNFMLEHCLLDQMKISRIFAKKIGGKPLLNHLLSFPDADKFGRLFLLSFLPAEPSALMICVLRNCSASCQFIIKNNVRYFLMERNSDRQTPFMVAAKIGNIKLVRLLIRYEDNYSIRNQDKLGRTAEMLATQNGHARVADYLNKIRTKRFPNILK